MAPHRQRSSLSIILILAMGVVAAQDQPAAPVPAPGAAPAAPPPAPPQGWTWAGTFGSFITNVYTSNDAPQSPDPAIASGSNATAYQLDLDADLLWQRDANAVDQKLSMKYGRIKQAGVPWSVNTDDARYDGILRHTMAKPDFIYLAWGAETVFQGKVPDTDPFDPFQAHVSAGIGQLYNDLLQPHDHVEWRLGVRAQKIWGEELLPKQGNFEVGPEALLRYECNLTKVYHYFVQYEGYSEFKDMHHVTNLVTAALSCQLARNLTAVLAFRAFYESRPQGVDPAVAGYSEWAVRQDTLVGLTATF